MREVIINGVDYNEYVESVTFSSGLDEGSAAEIMTIPGMPDIQPFSPIIVKMDGKAVFKGYVGAPEGQWTGNPPAIWRAKYECYNDGVGFKNILIDGAFSGTVYSVINQVAAKAAERWENNFSGYTVKVQTGIDANLNMVFTYTGLNDAFDQIASQISGHWCVTPGNVIYFFQDTIMDIEGEVITIEYKNVRTPYTHQRLTDEVINKVIVMGGEGIAESTQEWTYNGTENVFRIDATVDDISVTFNGDPVYLVPEGYSGDPHSDSDKDAANTVDAKASGNRNAAAITAVVIHHVAAKTATRDDLVQWHVVERGWTDIGYHWYIRKDGSVVTCRPELITGAHAKGHNSYTVGIAVEGDYDRFDTQMPKAQFDALVAKTRDVMSRYDIANNRVFYHDDLNQTACPGKYFPKQAVRDAVKTGNYSGSITYSGASSAAGADSSKKIYINISEQYLKIIPGFEPAVGTKIVARYKYGYPVNHEFVDAASVKRYGRVFPTVIADTGITNKEDAMRIANAYLKAYATVQENLSLELVDYQQLSAGDKVHLAWLNKDGLVTATQGELRYNVPEDNYMKIEVQLI